MKKLALAAVAVFAMSLGVASADPVSTPIGTVTVNEDGNLVYADGDAGNPNPLDGWASVDSNGKACADDNGSKGDVGGSPTCTP